MQSSEDVTIAISLIRLSYPRLVIFCGSWVKHVISPKLINVTRCPFCLGGVLRHDIIRQIIDRRYVDLLTESVVLNTRLQTQRKREKHIKRREKQTRIDRMIDDGTSQRATKNHMMANIQHFVLAISETRDANLIMQESERIISKSLWWQQGIQRTALVQRPPRREVDLEITHCWFANLEALRLIQTWNAKQPLQLHTNFKFISGSQYVVIAKSWICS